MDWTPRDATRAAREGWKYQNGYVARLYELDSQFTSVWQIIEHLRHKGRTSEWHRNVYLSLPWTEADVHMARLQGWQLVRKPELLIVKSVISIFTNNEEAQQRVLEQASANPPDPLCEKALARMARLRLLQGAAY